MPQSSSVGSGSRYFPALALGHVPHTPKACSMSITPMSILSGSLEPHSALYLLTSCVPHKRDKFCSHCQAP